MMRPFVFAQRLAARCWLLVYADEPEKWPTWLLRFASRDPDTRRRLNRIVELTGRLRRDRADWIAESQSSKLSAITKASAQETLGESSLPSSPVSPYRAWTAIAACLFGAVGIGLLLAGRMERPVGNDGQFATEANLSTSSSGSDDLRVLIATASASQEIARRITHGTTTYVEGLSSRTDLPTLAIGNKNQTNVSSFAQQRVRETGRNVGTALRRFATTLALLPQDSSSQQ